MKQQKQQSHAAHETSEGQGRELTADEVIRELAEGPNNFDKICRIGIKQAIQCPACLSQTFVDSIPRLTCANINYYTRSEGQFRFRYTLYIANQKTWTICVSPGEWVVELNNGEVDLVSNEEYTQLLQNDK